MAPSSPQAGAKPRAGPMVPASLPSLPSKRSAPPGPAQPALLARAL